MRTFHRSILSAVLVICLTAVGVTAFNLEAVAATDNDLSIDSVSMVSRSRISRFVYQYDLKATLINNGSEGYTDITATVTSSAPGTVVVDDTLEFPDMEAGETAESLDTISIQQDRRVPFNLEALAWEINAGSGEPDMDGDGVPDDIDNCPETPNPDQLDLDGDGAGDACDECLDDPFKIEPGICGCGESDSDGDGDGTPDCIDDCPNDPGKIEPGICGCGVSDSDGDGDGTPDCFDSCPNDPLKIEPGICGCGVADIDGDGDGTPDCFDLCPNDPLKIEPGACGCGVPDIDSDNDGTPDCLDGCPEDPLKISEGVCGCGTPDTDTDLDGTPDCIDYCPEDPGKIDPGICGCGTPDTDTDLDGTVDCMDGCPEDPEKTVPGECGCGVSDIDSDGDGVADCHDLCPEDPEKIEPGYLGCGVADLFTIQGIVTGGGAGVPDAEVRIGTETVYVTTDELGHFTAVVGVEEMLVLPDNIIFPIEVTAPGFATGYKNVGYLDGQALYVVDISLTAPSMFVTEEDDIASGLLIEEDGMAVGSIIIPPESLPPGTVVTGRITYMDPTGPEVDGFPGGDFLAIRSDEDPMQDPPTMLESIGLMEFDLYDQFGNPITELEGPAEICMVIPDTLTDVMIGEVIPLWYYDPEVGLWVEDGFSTVEERYGTLMACGEVAHFTWWNVDRPVETHSCFTFEMVDEASGDPITDMSWYGKGVDYSGVSPARTCSNGSASLTIKRDASITVHTTIGGTNYFLRDNGDDTYSLISSEADATVFNTPDIQASCLLDIDVDQCQPLDGDDGVIPIRLSEINYAPVVHQFNLPDTLVADELVNVTARISDPDGDYVQLEWDVSCGELLPVPTIDLAPPYDLGVDNVYADYQAPSTMSYCELTITARDYTDSSYSTPVGNVTVASRHTWVQGDVPTGTYDGVVYGPDGQPVAGVMVTLEGENWGSGEPYSETTTTDATGYYIFEEIPCCFLECYDGEGCWSNPFSGHLVTGMDVGGNPWFTEMWIEMGCCIGMGEPPALDKADAEDNTTCTRDIRFPVKWGTYSGSYYLADGTIDTSLNETAYLEHWGGEFEGGLFGETPVMAGQYGPMLVPVGDGQLSISSTSDYVNYNMLNENQVMVHDIGPGALGSFTGIVYDNSGAPVADQVVELQRSPDYPTTTTGPDGSYTFDSISTIYPYNVSINDGSYTYFGYGHVQQRGQVVTVDVNGRNAQVTGYLYNYDGTPLEGVQINVSAYWSTYWYSEYTSTVTGADGSFIIDNLPALPPAEMLPTARINLDAEYFDPVSEQWVYIYRTFYVSTAGSTTEVDLVMNQPYSMCGGYYYGE